MMYSNVNGRVERTGLITSSTDEHLTLKMTSAQVVETSSVNNNSSFQNYPHLDDHTIRTTDTPGFTTFTIFIIVIIIIIIIIIIIVITIIISP